MPKEASKVAIRKLVNTQALARVSVTKFSQGLFFDHDGIT